MIVYVHGRKNYTNERDKCSAGHRTALVQQVSPVQSTLVSGHYASVSSRQLQLCNGRSLLN